VKRELPAIVVHVGGILQFQTGIPGGRGLSHTPLEILYFLGAHYQAHKNN